MLRIMLISLYLTSVLGFSFVSHPISCCLLLLGGAVSSSFLVYLSLGASWYLLLFCLVYVGGVYILFVYVSMYNPNLVAGLAYGWSLVLLSFFFFSLFFLGFSFDFFCFSEFSHYICSDGDGFGYCFFCLILLLGFGLVSFVSSSKDSFFR